MQGARGAGKYSLLMSGGIEARDPVLAQHWLEYDDPGPTLPWQPDAAGVTIPVWTKFSETTGWLIEPLFNATIVPALSGVPTWNRDLDTIRWVSA
jgi:hypothetical protein